MKPWRDPFFHFLAIGAGLFAVYGVVAEPEAPPREIVVTQSRIDALVQSFGRTWMRPPTEEELAGLVEDFVREEIFYREGVALGLDRDDLVIRRRVRQKLEFLSDDLADAVAPTDAELQSYLDAHPDAFRRPGTFDFAQIHFDPDRRGPSAVSDAGSVLARLNGPEPPADVEQLGDATLLPARLERASETDVERRFGNAFATGLAQAPVGRWSGPIESGFGVHLVRVDAREPGRVPPLAEIRQQVEREWMAERRREADAAFYAELRGRYDVRFEGDVSAARRLAEGAQP